MRHLLELPIETGQLLQLLVNKALSFSKHLHWCVEVSRIHLNIGSNWQETAIQMKKGGGNHYNCIQDRVSTIVPPIFTISPLPWTRLLLTLELWEEIFLKRSLVKSETWRITIISFILNAQNTSTKLKINLNAHYNFQKL